MGGTRNRDAKMKANKVFSSGGGGGSKGPAVVDKRGQEQPCPYCDKIYKESGRLREHIASKHADKVAPAAADAPSTSAAAGASKPAALAPAKAPAQAAVTKDQPASKAQARPTPVSIVPAAAAAAKGPQTGPAGAAAASSTSQPVVSIMDIGSKAGYYTHKSPKLQLLEWTQKEKMLKPRYSARQQEGGLFACKVVLPDAKRSDNDIVVFLDEGLAAADAAEAEQRAAVAALHRVAGDRQLQMLLPPQYRDVWQQLKCNAEQKAVERSARAAAAEQRRQRDRDRKANMALRGPKAVVMSEAKQALLQSLLKEGFAASGGQLGNSSAASGAATRPRAAPLDAATVAEIEAELLPMGFSQQQVQQAAAGVAGHRKLASTPACSLALDWLFIHLPREQLPAHFTKGSKTNMVTVLASGSGARQAQSTADVPGAVQQLQSEVEGDAMSRLGARGYLPSECSQALSQCGGDDMAALPSLYEGLTGVRVDLHTTADAPAAWEEEVMVLEAIYGPDACSTQSGDGSPCIARVLIDLPEGSLAAALAEALKEEATTAGGSGAGAANHQCQLGLEFFCPSAGEGEGHDGYPSVSPLVAASCAALPAACLRRMTRRLSRLAAAAAADASPMLHDLVTAAGEMLAGEWHLQQQGAAEVPGARPRTRKPLEESSDEEGGEQLEDGLDDWEAGGAGHVAGEEAEDDEDEEGEGEEDSEAQAAAAAAEAAAAAALDYEQQAAGEPWETQQRLSAAGAGAGAGAGVGSQASAQGEEEEPAAAGAGTLVEGFDDLTLADEAEEPAVDQVVQQEAPAPGAKPPAPRRQRQPARARLSPAEAEAESRRLATHQSWLHASQEHASIRAQRQGLPAASKRGELLQLLAVNPVLVISGATGCGKSTQVPQYILEDAIASGVGAGCNIIVTQPRRISALGLAARVSAERGEDVGQTVGYSVRLESKTSVRTRLLFCTTGVLLRRLLNDPSLDTVSHVVLDEVHERSVEIDLLLMLLRDVAHARAQRASVAGSGATPLRLILMSATADADLFANYMQQGAGQGQGQGQGRAKAGGASQLSVGMITIPGFTYPVREFYLEDILERTGLAIGRGSRYAKKGGPKASGKDEAGWWDGPDYARYSEQTRRSLSVVDEDQVNYDALLELMCLVAEQQQRQGPKAFLSDWQEATPYLAKLKPGQAAGGAVLVFLPGAPEISRAQRALLASERLAAAAGGRQNLRILALHGSLSSDDQRRVFVRPPPGTLKIVLATNVAETSITIDDVTFVVDTGRAKEMTHDAERSILRLQEGFISQAAAQQRRGRAGRVRPGVCFRLFSRHQWSRMPSHTSPEMLRSPLERVAMLIKGLSAGDHQLLRGATGPGGVARVLARCLSPPQPVAVAGATRLLRQMGAFDDSEELTALGGHLNRMPMDPGVGKMLVYGAMLGCLDPVLTVAAALAHGRPILLSAPPDQQKDLALARAPILRPGVDSRSDHLVLVAAFNGWVHARTKGGRQASSQYCQQYQLSESSLEAVQAGRAEYANTLADLGFIARDDARELDGKGWGRGVDGTANSPWLSRAVNRNWGNARFLKAAICAGFYPNILRVQPPKPKYKEVEGGAFEVDPEPSQVKFFDRERGRAFMHPGSINFSIGRFSSGYMVFTSMTHTSKLFVREASMVPVYSLLLFGGGLEVDMSHSIISVDGWAQFKAPASIGILVKGLRAELEAVLAAKIQNPSLELADSKAAAAVMELLSTDGF